MVLRAGLAGSTAAENYRQRTDSGLVEKVEVFRSAFLVEFRHHFAPAGDAVACIEEGDRISSSTLASRKRLVVRFLVEFGRKGSSKAFAANFVGFAVRR